MAIKTLLSVALENALNRYLQMDLDVSELLAPLAGKVIGLTVEPFGETVFLCPTHDGVQIIDFYPDKPDCRISGSILSLGMMGLSAKPMRSIFSGQVKIEGDTATGRRFQVLFDQLKIDFEEQLARFTGDIVAHQIGQLFRSGAQSARRSLKTLELDVGEFLQEETRALPAESEAEIFFTRIDTLRDDSERLLCRVERLESALARKQPEQHQEPNAE